MQLKNLLFLILVPISLNGCGGGDANTHAGGTSKLSDSQGCIAATCHAGAVSGVTRAAVAEEWRASVHNTRDGAGCADCHEPDAGHPSLCSKCHGGGGFAVTRNPDRAGKCGKCHGLSHPDDAMMARAPQHFGYSTARSLPQKPRASFVSGRYQGRCRACHNPHGNTVTAQHREYAKSLHGDPKGVAWTYYDFKQDSYAACNRCHTSTGFINFVTSNFTVATKGVGTGDASRELIACDACHASYDFKNSIRKVPAFTAPYKGHDAVNKATFPDVGETNLCIPCHAGRESGQSIDAVANFGNAGFVNSHYLASAGLMYMQIGFINFTSPDAVIGSSTYGKTLSPDNITTPGGVVGGTSSTHRKFGTKLMNGSYYKPSFFVAGVMDENGPCVTCHLNANGVAPRPGSGHSLKIGADAYRQVCINCHTSEHTIALTAENFHTAFLEPQSEAFQLSLELIEHLLESVYRISYNEATYPYFYDDNLPLVNGKKQAVRDWTRGGTVDGRKLMGACFNLNLLVRDPAAYAHARSYSRRLVYDSADFLDDGRMNLSVSVTAVNSGLKLSDGVTPVFVKDTLAYNTSGGGISTVFGTTSEAMLYLVGWSRSTGNWNAVERP